MQLFLKEVAHQLFEEFGNEPDNHCVVFPNRRSSLYFSKYLAEETDNPIWSPGLVTINELFIRDSDQVVADEITLVFELFSVYKGLRNSTPTSLDDFFFWGEMMINDFDDIDKYLVNARTLFSNLKDLKEIEDRFGGLSPETAEIVHKFWANFAHGRMTAEKSDFLAVWEILGPLYMQFKNLLRGRGIAYEGMILRDQIEKLESGKWNPGTDFSCYHFVGFNALNLCEERLMTQLKRSGVARFYWDYDDYYLSEKNPEFKDVPHEAGHFITANLKKFGQDLSGSYSYGNLIGNNSKTGKWKVYSSPSDIAQAKLVPAILDSFGSLGDDPDETAIILTDEKLLLPVLNTMPEAVKNTNITMGYPLCQTPLYSLVHNLLGLQKNLRIESGSIYMLYTDVLRILKHQYIASLHGDECASLIRIINEENIISIPSTMLCTNNLFELLFRKAEGASGLVSHLRDIIACLNPDRSLDSDKKEEIGSSIILRREYAYRLTLALNQLQSIFEKSGQETGINITIRLIDRIMKGLIIPFAGEPLKGLQIMGILETRALDFKNIVFLSVNEGKLPGTVAGNSYIPYNLREAFGLPTIKHQDSIYAYYFYRLLHKAENVSFIYNNNSEGIRSGEMSRFLLQLKYGANRPVFRDTRFLIVPPGRFKDKIPKEDRITDILKHKYMSGGGEHFLSPSALNTWVVCQMKFYYQYVSGLKEPEDIMEKVDSPVLGNILHEAMNQLLKPFIGKKLGNEEISELRSDKDLISHVVRGAIRKKFLKNEESKISGSNLVVSEVVTDMIERILEIDADSAPIELVSLEERHTTIITVPAGNDTINVSIGGMIDRIDKVRGVTRILDYKSGRDSLEVTDLDNLFEYNSQRNGAAFQTLVYCEIYSRIHPDETVRPALYPVRKMYSDSFRDLFEIKRGESAGSIFDYSAVREYFLKKLEILISDIFDKSVPFRMTSRTGSCTYCPFNIMCSRQNVK
ncbi:MAG TPA: PD-(D/E)XK nuclease family protein [Bacteroidales bacterium]|nr:PD-(D/E)XK nuclease family protein [Bacteroidales bacterium]